MSSSVILNGKNVSIPKGFFDVGVKASFGEEIQANLTTDDFTFILDGYEEIINWINNGRNGGVGIFEGIPLSISNSNTENNVSVFRGIVDLQAGHTIQEKLRQVSVRLRQDDSLNALDELLQPLDYGYLRDLGVITESDYVDVDYVVNKIDNGLESITTFITIFLLGEQLADSIFSLGETPAISGGIAASGISGPVGAAIYTVAILILRVIYAATLLILIINFGIDLFNVLIQPQRTHKGIPLKTLLSKACEYIGYGFETTIDDLNFLVYLPSNQNVDEFGLKNILNRAGTIEQGIPNPSDIGYSCPELFQSCRDMFEARFAIVGNTVQFHAENSLYWVTQSGYQKPQQIRNVAERSFRYNTDESKSSVLIQFQRDLVEEYTIQNYRGTAFQILTDAKAINNPSNKTIKNFERVDIPFCLASRKENLNSLERSLLGIALLFDTIGGIFGGSPNLANRIVNKVGVLEVSNNNHSIPKLIWMSNGRIPINHRDLFSAKTLWEKIS